MTVGIVKGPFVNETTPIHYFLDLPSTRCQKVVSKLCLRPKNLTAGQNLICRTFASDLELIVTFQQKQRDVVSYARQKYNEIKGEFDMVAIFF